MDQTLRFALVPDCALGLGVIQPLSLFAGITRQNDSIIHSFEEQLSEQRKSNNLHLSVNEERRGGENAK